MSDPFEKLSSLGSALEGAPMPLSAEEIRSRGDRIRRRTHALIAAGSAVAVVAVAVPVYALTSGSGSGDRVDPADTALSADDLITDAETVYHEESGGSDWVTVNTFPGDGQAAFHPCSRESLTGLGATDVYQREFELQGPDGTAAPGDWMNESIAEFDDEEAAREAYATLAEQVTDCDGQIPDVDTYDVREPVDADPGVDGEAQLFFSTYGPVPEEIDPFGTDGYLMETGVIVSGNRLAVLTSVIIGQDYNFGVTPVERMIPPAAERLQPGGAAPSETPSSTDSPPDTTAWPTEIPDGFPLTSGMPEDDGSSEHQLDPSSADNQAMIPAGELTACGSTPREPGALDRLTTRLTGPSDSQIRELLLLADDQEAVTYIAHLRNLYQSCPSEDSGGGPPTFTTTVDEGALGDESLDIRKASDGIGRVAITVVRIGNAVLVENVSDEGNGSEVDSLATAARENLADVIGEMNELMADPTGPTEPGLTDPAGTTTIPDGFPLDVHLDQGAEQAQQVNGPGRYENGVFSTTLCETDAAALSRLRGNRLGYGEVYEGEGYHGRALRTYPTVQDAVDELELLREQLAGCERDVGWEETEERVWRVYPAETGYDEVTFGHTYDGPPAGTLYTVVRVGNALLMMQTGGEFDTTSIRSAIPDHQDLVRAIAPEMCVFTEDGC